MFDAVSILCDTWVILSSVEDLLLLASCNPDTSHRVIELDTPIQSLYRDTVFLLFDGKSVAALLRFIPSFNMFVFEAGYNQQHMV